MGQDRQFTADEIKFVLSAVQHFKNCWEEAERKNLEADIKWKVEGAEFDKNYTDHFRALDDAEMEKQIEEALTNVQNTKTAEGEDEMTDAEKDAVSKQAKFNILKKGFYDPEGASEFKAKNEASMMSGS